MNIACMVALLGASAPLPGGIDLRASAIASVVELSVQGRPVCSGVRVSATHVLTAAHCVVGLSGTEQHSVFTTQMGGQVRSLYVVEVGAFWPDRGEMADFAVLRGDLAATPIAPLATRAQLMAADAVDDSLKSHAVHVWAVGFSEGARRETPRPAPTGLGVFVSPGWVKSATAYQHASVLAILHGFIFDETVKQPLPPQQGMLAEAWAQIATHGVHQVFGKYEAAGAPILYHSADYAPGASGGGVFLDDGRLLGIIPYGTTVASRTRQYPGFGQLFRIDTICRQSKVLATTEACRLFVGKALMSPAVAAFKQLSTLVGDWEAQAPAGSAKGMRVTYELMANESALVETDLTVSGRKTMTVFHIDGEHLVATHFCAQGNQPRLRLTASTGDSLSFDFWDGTNLASQAHLRHLDLGFHHGQLSRKEVYVARGKDEASAVTFVRVK